MDVYRFVIEIIAESEDEARLRGEELIAQEGLGDLESIEPYESSEDEDDELTERSTREVAE